MVHGLAHTAAHACTRGGAAHSRPRRVCISLRPTSWGRARAHAQVHDPSQAPVALEEVAASTEVLSVLSPSQLASAVWHYAKQGCPRRELMHALLAEVHFKLGQFRCAVCACEAHRVLDAHSAWGGGQGVHSAGNGCFFPVEPSRLCTQPTLMGTQRLPLLRAHAHHTSQRSGLPPFAFSSTQSARPFKHGVGAGGAAVPAKHQLVGSV